MINFGYWAIGLLLVMVFARFGFIKVSLKGWLLVIPFFTVFPWAIGYGLFEMIMMLK